MRWLVRRRLKNSSDYTRKSAIRKLEKYGRSETALIAAMLSDPANEVRSAACEVLGRLKDPGAIERLGDLMLGRFGDGNSGEPYFARRSAADALGEIADQRSIPLLIQALGDRDEPMLRADAAFSLGHLRASAAVESLIDQLSNSMNHAAVHEKAALALAEIGGERANAFVLKIFDGHLVYNNDRPNLALAIWAEAAKGYSVDAQILAATKTLAEDERVRQKLGHFRNIIIT